MEESPLHAFELHDLIPLVPAGVDISINKAVILMWVVVGLLKSTNPDTGPAMMWGEHHFDKGYESDADVFKRNESYPGDVQRGNEYVKNNREIISRDSKKLKRSEFTKIA